jgi:hypothetical protein
MHFPLHCADPEKHGLEDGRRQTLQKRRGSQPGGSEQDNRLLETGHATADIVANIALESAKTRGAPGAAPVSHCEQLRTAAAVWAQNLPQ